jgi:hypothetical protein
MTCLMIRHAVTLCHGQRRRSHWRLSHCSAASSKCFPNAAIEFKREAVSGKTTKMWNYGSWDRNCETKGGVVKLLTKPSHGTATPRRTVAVAKFNRFDPSDHCLGKPVSMFQVLYTSARGFHGTDTFQIERTLRYGRRDIDTFTVEVR